MYKIPASTLFIAKNLVFVPECHSTNDLALQLCQQSQVTDGTLVITNKQTRGRGQRGNSWEAAAGLNLTLSVVLRPIFLAIRDQFFLNIIASLAVQDFLQTQTPRKIAVKWPNDIMLDGKKICGILIENQIMGTQFQSVVVGIGININQTQFAPELPATSLSAATGSTHNLQELLENLMHKLEIRYLQLKEGRLKQLKEEYIRALYWRNEVHTFATRAVNFEGIISDIDDTGRLRVEVGDTWRSYDLKEITYIR